MLLPATQSYLDGSAASWPSSRPQPRMPGETINPPSQTAKDKNIELCFICRTEDKKQPTSPTNLPDWHKNLFFKEGLAKVNGKPSCISGQAENGHLDVAHSEVCSELEGTHMELCLHQSLLHLFSQYWWSCFCLWRFQFMGWKPPPFYRE